VKWTTAVPLPLELLIEIHDAPAAAVHEHPSAVVIVVVKSAGTDMQAAIVTGATEYPHVGGGGEGGGGGGGGGGSGIASCGPTRTATACPATVSVPVRSVVETFAPTETSTLPLPVPVAPATTVIHSRSDVAVHAQLAAVVTVIEAEPPAAPKARLEADSVNVHGSGVGSTGVVL
jgi:hypothetical protein